MCREIEYRGKSAEGKARALSLTVSLSGGDALCHGDFHPDNLLVADGQLYLIDWMNLVRGDARYDIARTLFLLEASPMPPGAERTKQLADLRRLCAEAYLKHMNVERAALSEFYDAVAAVFSD